jgi:hypothetical protein
MFSINFVRKAREVLSIPPFANIFPLAGIVKDNNIHSGKMKKQIILLFIIGLTIISCKQNKIEMKEKIVKTNEIELFTQSFGKSNNPAILLIAGATVSMLYWDTEFCQKLANKGFL